MAVIIESVILSQNVQVDGRIDVTERHTFDNGYVETLTYLAEAEDDLNLNLSFHAQTVEALNVLRERDRLLEFIENLDNDPSEENLRFIPRAAYLNHLRTLFSEATGLRAVRLGQRLALLSNLELRSLFNYDATQVTLLRTKLNQFVNIINNLRNAVGE